MTTLTKVLKSATNVQLNQIHTCLPGVIEKYEYTTQKATVKPLIKKVYRDGQVSSLPIIVEVPVVWPRSSNASLTFPVNNGDYVLLLFAERSIERFLEQGGEREPGDSRKFDLTDAIAIPGLYPFSEESRADNNEDVLLIYNDTSVRITQDGNFEVEAAQDQVITVENNSDISIKGDSKIAIDGDSKINVKGNHNVVIESDTSLETENLNITVNSDATMDVSGKVDLTATGDVNLEAPNVNITGNVSVDGDLEVSGQTDLAGGGPGIARVGDDIEATIVIPSGSSAGTYKGSGSITSGSNNSTSN